MKSSKAPINKQGKSSNKLYAYHSHYQTSLNRKETCMPKISMKFSLYVTTIILSHVTWKETNCCWDVNTKDANQMQGWQHECQRWKSFGIGLQLGPIHVVANENQLSPSTLFHVLASMWPPFFFSPPPLMCDDVAANKTHLHHGTSSRRWRRPHPYMFNQIVEHERGRRTLGSTTLPEVPLHFPILCFFSSLISHIHQLLGFQSHHMWRL